MSATLSPTGGRSQKSTCRKCNRTVILIPIGAGRVEVDPEIINAVPFEGAKSIMMSRRVHADMCVKYQLENEKKAARAKMAAGAPFAGGVGKRPKGSL